jgi:hypothetical protein
MNLIQPYCQRNKVLLISVSYQSGSAVGIRTSSVSQTRSKIFRVCFCSARFYVCLPAYHYRPFVLTCETSQSITFCVYCNWRGCLSVCRNVMISRMRITQRRKVRFGRAFLFCSSTPGLPARKRWLRNSLTFKVNFKVICLEKYRNQITRTRMVRFGRWLFWFVCIYQGYRRRKDNQEIFWYQGQFEGHTPITQQICT